MWGGPPELPPPRFAFAPARGGPPLMEMLALQPPPLLCLFPCPVGSNRSEGGGAIDGPSGPCRDLEVVALICRCGLMSVLVGAGTVDGLRCLGFVLAIALQKILPGVASINLQFYSDDDQSTATRTSKANFYKTMQRATQLSH